MNILWAFEPFYQNLGAIKSMHLLLKNLSSGSTLKIQFLSVVNRHESGFANALDVPEVDRFTTYPRQLINSNLKKARVPIESHDVSILNQDTPSLTKTVDKFLQVSDTGKYRFLCLFTNSRTSNSFLSIGSFTESIIHRSKTSLIVLNPKAEVSRKIKRITLAIDFEKNNSSVIEFVLNLCKKNGYSFEIIYHTNLTYGLGLSEPTRSMVNYRNRIEKYKADISKLLSNKGINFKIKMITDLRSTAEVILQESKIFKSNLLILNAQKTRLHSLIGGSTTRSLVKSSYLPLVILK